MISLLLNSGKGKTLVTKVDRCLPGPWCGGEETDSEGQEETFWNDRKVLALMVVVLM